MRDEDIVRHRDRDKTDVMHTHQLRNTANMIVIKSSTIINRLIILIIIEYD